MRCNKINLPDKRLRNSVQHHQSTNLRKKRHITGFIVAALVSAMMVSSCGTKKKSREELSLLGKAYHNTTALYNGYFNANEIMEATYLQLDQSHKENFTELLPIFPYELANADNVKADLDRAPPPSAFQTLFRETSNNNNRSDAEIAYLASPFSLGSL